MEVTHGRHEPAAFLPDSNRPQIFVLVVPGIGGRRARRRFRKRTEELLLFLTNPLRDTRLTRPELLDFRAEELLRVGRPRRVS